VQYGDFDGVGLDAFPLVIERTDYAATVKGLATLSQLYCLHCKNGGWLVEEFFTLLPLTSLTALTALQLVDYDLDEPAWHDFRLRQVCQASRKGYCSRVCDELCLGLGLGSANEGAISMWQVCAAMKSRTPS
jgi:hypothetical protein